MPKAKKIYIGNTQVRPVISPRTFTISWAENSNMSSGWNYSDDATGLTAGSAVFDDFFWYSAVKLASDGTETASVSQNAGVLDITQLWTLTSWDNVMIKFPVRWIKMTKSSNVVTLSITEELGKSGYQYYAFQKTGNVNSNDETTATYDLYLWAYLGYNSSWVTKSRSWKTPSAWALSGFISGSAANWTGWTIMWWYQRCLINAYYMMKYGNPNSQSVVGKWYTGWSSLATTGNTNSQTNATYWTSSTTQQIKLFWLEDFWGNAWTFIWWICTASSNQVYVALHDFASSYSTSSPYVYLFQNSFTTGRETSGIQWTNKWMFMPNNTINNSAYNTYYCDGATTYNNWNCRHWWDYSQWEQAWIFRIWFYESTGTTQWARLMYL